MRPSPPISPAHEPAAVAWRSGARIAWLVGADPAEAMTHARALARSLAPAMDDPPLVTLQAATVEGLWGELAGFEAPSDWNPAAWQTALARGQSDGLTVAGLVRALADGARLCGGLLVALGSGVPALLPTLAERCVPEGPLGLVGCIPQPDGARPGVIVTADGRSIPPEPIDPMPAVDTSPAGRWRRVDHHADVGDVDAVWSTAEALMRHLVDVGRLHEAARLTERILTCPLADGHRARALGGRADLALYFGAPIDPMIDLERAATLAEGVDLGSVLMSTGTVHLHRGEIDDALLAMARGVALLEQGGEAHREDLAEGLETLAITLQMTGDHPGAIALAERARQLLIEVYGTERHPAVVRLAYSRALMLFDEPDATDVRAFLTHLVDISLTVFGTVENRITASTLDMLALVAMGEGDGAAALLHARRALGARIGLHGVEAHAEVAAAHQTLAMVLLASSDIEAAAHHATQAVELAVAAFGDPHRPQVIEAQVVLGRIQRAAGQTGEARATLRAARAAASMSPVDPSLTAALLEVLADVELAAGDAGAARETLEARLRCLVAVYGDAEHAEVQQTARILAEVQALSGDVAAARETRARWLDDDSDR